MVTHDKVAYTTVSYGHLRWYQEQMTVTTALGRLCTIRGSDSNRQSDAKHRDKMQHMALSCVSVTTV